MKKTILIFLSFLFLVNCSGNSLFDDATKEDEKGTPGIFSSDSKKGLSITDLLSQNKEDNIGLNINAYLWRASINILSIAPLLSTDTLGGVIITDWYINRKTPNKRIKITAFVKTKELRSNGIKVKVHIQKMKNGVWSETFTNKSIENQIENNILNEARNIRINSKK